MTLNHDRRRYHCRHEGQGRDNAVGVADAQGSGDDKGVEKNAPRGTEVMQVVAALSSSGGLVRPVLEAGRADLVDKENAEIAVLEFYLPPAASADDIDAAVAAAIAESGATSPKDMGKVMKAVMPKLAGKNADGKAVNEAVRRKLGA